MNEKLDQLRVGQRVTVRGTGTEITGEIASFLPPEEEHCLIIMTTYGEEVLLKQCADIKVHTI